MMGLGSELADTKWQDVSLIEEDNMSIYKSTVQGGRLALGPFRLSKIGMAPLLAPFRSEWTPLGGPGDRNFDAGTRFRALFLV